jgi:hypothetical protein
MRPKARVKLLVARRVRNYDEWKALHPSLTLMTFEEFARAFDIRLRELISSEASLDITRADSDERLVWKRPLGSVSLYRMPMSKDSSSVTVLRQSFRAPDGAVTIFECIPLNVYADEVGLEEAAQFASWIAAPTATP